MLAFNWIRDVWSTTAVFFLPSLSAIVATKRDTLESRSDSNKGNIVFGNRNSMLRHDLAWIPTNGEIPGNEMADKEAKKVLKKWRN